MQHLDLYKGRAMLPILIWSNITVVENVGFQEILALTELLHICSSKRVTVQKQNSVIINI